MSTIFTPGQFSPTQFLIQGGGQRRGGWDLTNWQTRLKVERWLAEQEEIAARAARRTRKKVSEDGELADLLQPAEIEVNHFGRPRAASLDGTLQFALKAA